MKQRTDSYMRIIIFVLCCIVSLYIVFSMILNPGESFATYKAVHYEVGDGLSTSGFVVRDEKVLTSSASIVVLERSEGDRVSAGQAVATSYASEPARQRQAQIRQLEDELAQMEYAHSYAGSQSNTRLLDDDIVESVRRLNLCVVRQDFSAAASAGEQLKSYVLRRNITPEDKERLWQRILATRDRLAELRSEAGDETGSISAAEAGYFSAVVDGYESTLSSALLDTVDTAALSELAARHPTAQQNAIGKLVTSPRWYYVCKADSAAMKSHKEGEYIDVRFSYGFYAPIQMRISRIGADEDGVCVLVLTTDRWLSNVIGVRQVAADLIFADIVGLRIPKTALSVVDGVSGVYVLDGARAVWKPVEILYSDSEYLIVREDTSSTKNLWPEDEVILSTDELFDRKVMK